MLWTDEQDIFANMINLSKINFKSVALTAFNKSLNNYDSREL